MFSITLCGNRRALTSIVSQRQNFCAQRQSSAKRRLTHGSRPSRGILASYDRQRCPGLWGMTGVPTLFAGAPSHVQGQHPGAAAGVFEDTLPQPAKLFDRQSNPISSSLRGGKRYGCRAGGVAVRVGYLSRSAIPRASFDMSISHTCRGKVARAARQVFQESSACKQESGKRPRAEKGKSAAYVPDCETTS